MEINGNINWWWIGINWPWQLKWQTAVRWSLEFTEKSWVLSRSANGMDRIDLFACSLLRKNVMFWFYISLPEPSLFDLSTDLMKLFTKICILVLIESSNGMAQASYKLYAVSSIAVCHFPKQPQWPSSKNSKAVLHVIQRKSIKCQNRLGFQIPNC